MTTIEKIRAEIQTYADNEAGPTEIKAYYHCLQIIDKYAEQEPCDDAISRQAIEKISRFDPLEPYNSDYVRGFIYGHDRLLNEIRKLPSVRPQDPCEDAVSRKDVTEYVCREICTVKVNCKDSVDCSCKMLKKMNSKLPSVQSKTGHWVFDDDCKEHGHCSRCGYGSVDLVGREAHDFCPKCGARMVESQESTKYEPTCPRGYTDCVNDPAYIKRADTEWYRKLYGDKTPEEAAEECRQKVMKDPDEKYYCYDDEDK